MDKTCLIFDIDGTLWDSRRIVAEGYNAQLKKEGREDLFVDVEILRKTFGKVMTEISDILFGTVPESERYALMDRCMESQRIHMEEDPCQVGYPEVRETLEDLAERHRLFIVSNSQSGYPQIAMSKLGIGDLIEDTLCYGDTGTQKGATIRTLMEKHHLTDAVYIGDTQGDLDASREAGLPFVWASYGFGTPEEWNYKIDTFAQLKELF